MIHLQNNIVNKMVFVETLPRNFILYLKHKQSRNEYSIAALNDINVNTQCELFLNNMEAGEYLYKLIYDGITYETGLAKMVSTNVKEVKSYEKTNNKKYKLYDSE